MFYWIFNRKRSFRIAFVVSFIVTALASCTSQRQPATFYPIDSLVSGQIRYLTSIHARLFKEAFLSGNADTLTYSPKDTLQWISELDVFRKLDIINKPVNRDSYLIDDGLFDPGSNLTVRAFKSLKKLPVAYLKIYYQGVIGKPRKVEALYKEENILYQSTRVLSMDFQQIENRTVLTSYEIKGGQKMVFGDSVTFNIRGKVLVD